MKNNKIISEMQDLVKSIQAEGFKDDVFGLAFGKSKDGETFLQAWSYDLNVVDLDDSYTKSWAIAKHLLCVIDLVYKGRCQTVNCLVCDEVDVEVFEKGKILYVMNLAID